MTFTDYVTAKLGVPFAWGKQDCVTFAIGWVEIARGKKYLPKKIWKSEREAQAEIKRRGGIVAAFDAEFTRIAPHYAKDGDLAFYDNTVWLFSGPHIVSTGQHGLEFRSRLEVQHAWSV